MLKMKGKQKSKRLNKKTFVSLQQLQQNVTAGYPTSNPKSHEKDRNGHTAIFKAYEINFSNKNYVPYLQMSFEKNKNKYSKIFFKAIKANRKTFDKKLDKLGEEMVGDIKATLQQTQKSPPTNNKGCIFGAVSYIKAK